jgi:small subunit ribosomal protein S18
MGRSDEDRDLTAAANEEAGEATAAPEKPDLPPVVKTSESGFDYVDYKDTETLRRLTSNNGKLNGRRRNSASAKHQRMIARAVKRARFMALLPYQETA